MIAMLGWIERRIGAGNLAFVIFLVGMLVLWGLQAAWGGWSRNRLRDRAETAEAAAEIAQHNAGAANAGAEAATAARSALDEQLPPLRAATESRSEAIDAYEDPDQTDADLLPPDAGVLRQLEIQEREARAAADRLRRTRTR